MNASLDAPITNSQHVLTNTGGCMHGFVTYNAFKAVQNLSHTHIFLCFFNEKIGI